MVSLTALLAFRCGRSCETDLLSSVRSPAGHYRAIEYFLDCEGATGPGSYEVSIIHGSDKPPKGAGNVLGLQPARQGNARVKLRWLAENELEVTYEKSATVQHRRASVDGVAVRYIAQQDHINQPTPLPSGA
jgi:hypothetical protein